jgi:hypothetical protein
VTYNVDDFKKGLKVFKENKNKNMNLQLISNTEFEKLL